MSVILLHIEEISSLNLDDFACLVAQYKTLDKPRKDLSRYTPEELKAAREAKKRFSDGQINKDTLGLVFDCDMTELEFVGFDYVMNLYSQYRKFGTLPFQGGLAEQPNKIMECFNVLSALQNEEAIAQQKEQEKQLKQKTGKRK